MGNRLRAGFAHVRSEAPGPNPRRVEVRRPNWLTVAHVGMSGHAVERYRERFDPDLSLAEARAALRRRLDHGSAVFSKAPPPWLVRGRMVRSRLPENHRGYLSLDDEMVLPLRESRYLPDADGRVSWQRFYVVTCLRPLWFVGGVARCQVVMPAEVGERPRGAAIEPDGPAVGADLDRHRRHAGVAGAGGPDLPGFPAPAPGVAPATHTGDEGCGLDQAARL